MFKNARTVNTRIVMPQNPDVLNSLRRLGLNQYEAKAYFALCTTGANTAGEISERAELPRPRVYDVLSSLQDKGFVAVQQGRPVKYRSLDIGEAVRILKKQKASFLQDEIKKIDELSIDLSSKISSSVPQTKYGVEDNVWTLKGRESIYSKLASMIADSKKHVILAAAGDSLSRKLGEHGKLLEKAKNRGVKISVLSTLKHPLAQKLGRQFNTDLPSRLVVADDQAMLFLTPHETQAEDEVGLWLNSPHIAETLKGLVEKQSLI